MSVELRFILLMWTTGCQDTGDAVSLIPEGGIFEHRTFNPAVFLFHLFVEQICGHLVSWIVWEAHTRVELVRCLFGETAVKNTGRQSRRECGEHFGWDAGVVPVKEGGGGRTLRVGQASDCGKAVWKSWPAQQEALVQRQTIGESVLSGKGEPPHPCCAQSWAGILWKVGGLCLETEAGPLDSCSWSVQLPALLRRVFPEGRCEWRGGAPPQPQGSLMHQVLFESSLTTWFQCEPGQVTELVNFCCYCFRENSSTSFTVFLWAVNECLSHEEQLTHSPPRSFFVAMRWQSRWKRSPHFMVSTWSWETR